MAIDALRSPTKGRVYIPKNKKHELSIQQRVSTYLRRNYPHIDFHSDYGAGLHLTQYQAKVNKSLQSGRGWPDMFIACPSRGYHGLFLELKKNGVAIYVTRGPNKGKLVANEQIQIEAAVLTRLNKLGYYARFSVGYEKAVQLIDWYFERPQNAELF